MNTDAIAPETGRLPLQWVSSRPSRFSDLPRIGTSLSLIRFHFEQILFVRTALARCVIGHISVSLPNPFLQDSNAIVQYRVLVVRRDRFSLPQVTLRLSKPIG